LPLAGGVAVLYTQINAALQQSLAYLDMTKTSPIHPSDLLGFGRLAIDATVSFADLVEAMHLNIAHHPGILGAPLQGPTNGITGLVYQSVRTVTGLVGCGIDAILPPLIPELGETHSPADREAMLAALNGAMGDYLAGTQNPLAIAMSLRHHGRSLILERRDLARAIPRLTNKLLLLTHGLCMNDLQWTRRRHNHGAALSRDLEYTPIYLHYNSGLHVSINGRAFADLVEALTGRWPVPLEDLAILGHSMGGLVARSAYHYASAAGYDWPRRLRKIVFLGVPHHGAPLELGGAWVNSLAELSPYTAALGRLGRIRSAGITDLRYGNLLDDDWAGRDRFRPEPDSRRPLPLPENVRCYAVGLIGDGLVPVDSALGRHKDPLRSLNFPESRRWLGRGLGHFDLLSDTTVYKRIRQWLA
jgi:hypothetical protein